MSAVVVDTHTLIWYTSRDPRRSTTARAALVNAEQTGVARHSWCCQKLITIPTTKRGEKECPQKRCCRWNF